jgi:hypothetical protein
VHVVKNASVLRDSGGRIIGAIESLTDLSDIVRARQEIDPRGFKEKMMMAQKYGGRGIVKMVSELDKLIQSKQTFLDAVAKADELAARTVEAANKSIPVFQKASAELRQVIKNHEGTDILETSAS